MQKHKEGKLPHFFMYYRRKKEMNQETIVLRKRNFKFIDDNNVKCYPRNWKNGIITFFKEKVTELPDRVQISISKGCKIYIFLLLCKK